MITVVIDEELVFCDIKNQNEDDNINTKLNLI